MNEDMDLEMRDGSTAQPRDDHNSFTGEVYQGNYLVKNTFDPQNPSSNFPFTPGASPLDFQQQVTASPRSNHDDTRFSSKPVTLTAKEACLYHHFTTHLGRWMDCTNASRILTLRITEMARLRPILHHAVICFAARQRGEDKIAGVSYQRCITLLIDRLDTDPADDETLLTSVILLHFADQLNGKLLHFVPMSDTSLNITQCGATQDFATDPT